MIQKITEFLEQIYNSHLTNISKLDELYMKFKDNTKVLGESDNHGLGNKVIDIVMWAYFGCNVAVFMCYELWYV